MSAHIHTHIIFIQILCAPEYDTHHSFIECLRNIVFNKDTSKDQKQSQKSNVACPTLEIYTSTCYFQYNCNNMKNMIPYLQLLMCLTAAITVIWNYFVIVSAPKYNTSTFEISKFFLHIHLEAFVKYLLSCTESVSIVKEFLQPSLCCIKALDSFQFLLQFLVSSIGIIHTILHD